VNMTIAILAAVAVVLLGWTVFEVAAQQLNAKKVREAAAAALDAATQSDRSAAAQHAQARQAAQGEPYGSHH